MARTRFIGAAFGGTDLAGAIIDRAFFSTGSAWHLPYRDVASMQGCAMIDTQGVAAGFSRPPLVIGGLCYPVMITDRHIAVGPCMTTHDQWVSGDFHLAIGNSDPEVAHFINSYKDFMDSSLAHFGS